MDTRRAGVPSASQFAGLSGNGRTMGGGGPEFRGARTPCGVLDLQIALRSALCHADKERKSSLAE